MFYVGQKVVAIKNHSQGRFKKGDEFIVKNIMDNFCKCCDTIVDVGHSGIYGDIKCNTCGAIGMASFVDWYKSSCFAPLETYGETYSIAIQLIQELEQVDKQKIFNPEKIKV